MKNKNNYLFILCLVVGVSTVSFAQGQSPQANLNQEIKEKFLPKARSLQNNFQRKHGYRGFRFEVIKLESSDPAQAGYILIDFKTENKWKLNQKNLGKLRGYVDYFEVSPEENRYYFGVFGEDFEIPISNRVSAQIARRNAHAKLKEKSMATMDDEERQAKMKRFAEKMQGLMISNNQ